MKSKIIFIVKCASAALVLGYFLFYFFSDYKVKYSLVDCVTYFDEYGQYQLINIVGVNYNFYDAKEQKDISTQVKYYTKKDDAIYAILLSGDYFYMDLNDFHIVISDDLNNYDDSIRQNFLDMDLSKLKDLTLKLNDMEAYLLKFVPHKFRRW